MTSMYFIVLLLLTFLIGSLLMLLAFKLRSWVWGLHNKSNILLNEMRQLRQAVKEASARQTKATADANLESVNATCLTALGLKFPVFLGSWSIDAFLGRWLVQHVHARRPKCIVELGSGSSTVLIAKTLALLNETNVEHIAIDHEAHFLRITRELAMLNDVGHDIQYLHCPLVRYESHDRLWYQGLAEKLAGKKIDLLLVDGPPGPLQPMSRLPALPELRSLLADNCTVVLDDSIRDDEQRIAKEWVKHFPDFGLTFQREGHGQAILSRHT